MNFVRKLMALMLVGLMTACGGGGGGSSAPADAGTAAPGGGTGSGTGGGGTGTPGGSGGGAGTQPGVELEGGVSGTGLNVGAVQGFSSVIVNGLVMDVSNADIFVDGELATQADLREGQGVIIIGDLAAEEAVRVEYRPVIRGPVTEVAIIDPLIGTATATVLGQVVRFNAATLYDNTELEALAIGDVLEISATADSSGVLVASYVELESGASTYQVVGRVNNLTADTFTIGTLVIDFSSAALANFNSASIAAIDTVVVRGAPSMFTAPDRLVAEEVARVPVLTINAGAEVELEGFIDSLNNSSSFSISGQPVVTDSATVFELGDASDLELNAKLEVEGSIQSDATLLASRITFRPLQAVRAEGVIEAVDQVASTVRVLGVTFSIRGTTELEDESNAEVEPLTLADLSIGDPAEVRGFIEGSTIVATELDREDAEPRARLRAPVAAFDATAATLSLFDIPLTTSASTEYEGDDDSALSQAAFFALLEEGLFVEAEWDNYVATSQPVDQLEIEDDD